MDFVGITIRKQKSLEVANNSGICHFWARWSAQKMSFCSKKREKPWI